MPKKKFQVGQGLLNVKVLLSNIYALNKQDVTKVKINTYTLLFSYTHCVKVRRLDSPGRRRYYEH